MPPIVNDRVAWSVGLSVGLSPSEPCRKFRSDRDTVCVQDSGEPRETPVAYSGPIRGEYCVVFVQHRTAIWLMCVVDPCRERIPGAECDAGSAAVQRPAVVRQHRHDDGAQRSRGSGDRGPSPSAAADIRQRTCRNDDSDELW